MASRETLRPLQSPLELRRSSSTLVSCCCSSLQPNYAGEFANFLLPPREHTSFSQVYMMYSFISLITLEHTIAFGSSFEEGSVGPFRTEPLATENSLLLAAASF